MAQQIAIPLLHRASRRLAPHNNKGFSQMASKLNRPDLAAGFPWLVADIGGSNARFGLILQQDMLVQHVKTIPVIAHPDTASAARAYLSDIAAVLGADFQAPRK
ncbi:MAG: hypothetical protein Q7U12_04830, partial [Undibacterium sp.]|nr:hypothetical protein [Undibacterium sp.]